MSVPAVKSESQIPPGFESMKQVTGRSGVYEEEGFTKHDNFSVKRGVSVGNDEYYYFYIKKGDKPVSRVAVHVEDGSKREKIFQHTSVRIDGFDISEASKQLRPFVEWARKNDPRLLDSSSKSMKNIVGKRGVYEEEGFTEHDSMYDEEGFTKHGKFSVKTGVSVGHIDEYYCFNMKEGDKPASSIVVHVDDGSKRDRIFQYTSVHIGSFDISEASKQLRPFVEWVRKNDPNLVDSAADPEKAAKFTPLK